MNQLHVRCLTSIAVLVLLGAPAAVRGQLPSQGSLPPKPIQQSFVKPDLRPMGPPPTGVAVVPNDAFSIVVKWTRAQASVGSVIYLSTKPDTDFFKIYSDSVPGLPADIKRAAGSATLPRASTSPTTSGNTIDGRAVQTPAFVATKLQPGSTFYVKAAAVYADVREGRSAALNVTTPPPPPPPNLKVTAQMRTVTLSWDPAPNAAAYRVIRNGQRIAELVPVTAFGTTSLKTGYTDLGESNTSYTYQVHAVYRYPLLPEQVGIATATVKTAWTFCVIPRQ
jgi:hypothetical protein